MANPEHLAKLKRGARAWNLWRLRQGRFLAIGDFRKARLTGADLENAHLHGSDLSGAHLQHADLSFAHLNGANLRAANAFKTNFNGAQLDGADFGGADLRMANFNVTDFRETDLTGAILGYTAFNNVDLSGAKGLERVKHLNRSSIGIDTIYKSKGNIPHVFLRGAGVPEVFITYMDSLNFTGIDFYSLFISHSTNDQDFAERLHADLQANGVRCWFAPHDMRSGKKVHEQIDEAIRIHEKLLLILSSASMKSEWVKTEISKARKREIKENRRVLFPIRLCPFDALRDWECFDSDAGKDSAREIREYFIPDFSNWKDHDAYKLAFDRLLKDLQGKAAPPSA